MSRVHIYRDSYARSGTTWSTFNQQPDSFESASVICPWSCDGAFSKIRVKAHSALASGRTRSLTFRKGATIGSLSNTALTCSFTEPSLEGSDAVNSASIAPGEYFDWAWGISPTLAGSDDLSASAVFTPTNPGEAGWAWKCASPSFSSSTLWAPLFTGRFNTLFTTTVGLVGDLIAVPGSLLRYDVLFSAAPGGAASRTVGIYKSVDHGATYTLQDGSGGAAGSIDTRTTVSGSSTTGTWSGTFPMAAGEVYLIGSVPSGSPADSRIAVSTCFAHTDTTKCNHFVTTQSSPTSSATTYNTNARSAWSTTETAKEIWWGLEDKYISELQVAALAAPGAGSITFDVRQSLASPTDTPSITLTGTDLYGSDAGTPVLFSSGYTFDLRSVSTGGSTGGTSLSFAVTDVIPAVVLVSVSKFVSEVFIDEDEEQDEVSTCTGDGEVAEAENPADGVSLATTTAPLYWMEVTLNDGSPATVYRWAQMAIPYGPPKEARVLRFGTLTRALSDIDGGFESATITSELQDIDGLIRAAWVSGALRGARVDYYCADLATLQADGEPDRRFRGYIARCEPAGDRTFRLTVEDALTNRLNAIDGQDLQAPTQLIEDRIADLATDNEFYDRPAPHLFGSISDEFGAWECPFVGTAEHDGEIWAWFLVSLGVVKVNEAFIAGLGVTPDIRVQVTDGDFEEGRPSVPGKPEWIEANDWSVRDGRRWTLVAGRAADPAIVLAMDGTIPLVVNVCGLLADQSLSSSPNGTVNSPALALLLLLNNYFVQDAVTDFLPILTDGDVPLFDTDSFNAVHDALVAMADSGYEPAIAGAVGGDWTQRSWRDRVAEFCRSFGYDIGINHHGQAILSVLDTTQGAAAFSFTADTILQGSVQFPTRLPVENEVRYVHTPNYLTPLGLLTPEPERRLPPDQQSSDWLSGMQVVRDIASITALGGSPRGRRRSAVQEYTLSRNAPQSAAVGQRRLDLLSPPNGRIEVALSLSIKHGCELELGQVGDVEHWDLPWTGSRRCRVMRLEEDMDGLTISPTFRDSDELLP